jgi:hypothetical protein
MLNRNRPNGLIHDSWQRRRTHFWLRTSVLKMEAVCFCEKLITTYKTKRRCNALNHNLLPSWKYQLSFTERRSLAVNTPASYLGDPRLKTRPGNRVSWLSFHDFPLSLQANGRYRTLKLSHDRFLLNPFQFIVHLSLFHSTLYRSSLSYWKSVVKLTTNRTQVRDL